MSAEEPNTEEPNCVRYSAVYNDRFIELANSYYKTHPDYILIKPVLAMCIQFFEDEPVEQLDFTRKSVNGWTGSFSMTFEPLDWLYFNEFDPNFFFTEEHLNRVRNIFEDGEHEIEYNTSSTFALMLCNFDLEATEDLFSMSCDECEEEFDINELKRYGGEIGGISLCPKCYENKTNPKIQKSARKKN